MANDFKRFQVNNATTNTGASGDALYTVPAGGGATALESIIIGITLSNTSATGITGDIFLDGFGGTDTFIVKRCKYTSWFIIRSNVGKQNCGYEQRNNGRCN
jgi:hypothetical protein